MFLKNAVVKFRSLLDEFDKIDQLIDREAQNRPVSEIISIALTQGWSIKPKEGKGSHTKLVHTDSEEFIILKKDEVFKGYAKKHLETIYKPYKVQLVKTALEDIQVRDMLRTLLTYSDEELENEIYRITRQYHDEVQRKEELLQTLTIIEEQSSFDDGLYDEAQNSIDSKNKKIFRYKKILGNLTQEQKAFKNEIQLLSNQKTTITLELNRKTQALQELIVQMQRLELRISELQQQLTYKDRDCQQLQDELSSLSQQSVATHELEHRIQQLQSQLTQAEIQRQNQVEALNQQRQELIGQHTQARQQLEQTISHLRQQLQEQQNRENTLQAWATNLQQELHQAQLAPVPITRPITRKSQKPLWISSAIVAAVVAFNPGPKWLNAVAVLAVPTVTLTLQKNR